MEIVEKMAERKFIKYSILQTQKKCIFTKPSKPRAKFNFYSRKYTL